MKKEIASPRLIPPTYTGFGFNNEEINREFYQKQLKKVKEIIEEGNKYIIFRTGDDYNGWFIGYDKQLNLMFYAVKYKRTNKRISGKALTQTLVWRFAGSEHAQGITNHMFFDVILKRTGSILSDRAQTPDGKQFWLNILTRAHTKGIPVAALDFNTNIMYVADKNKPVYAFLRKHFDSAYGYTNKHEAKRFLVGPI